MKIETSINGHKFSDYGVIVSSSKGVLAGLTPKEKVKQDWKDRHGECVLTDNLYFESREIELNCTLSADNTTQFINRIASFTKLFYGSGLNRLMIGATTNALVFEVYLSDKIDIDKRWREGKNIGRFTLKLKEPEPVKRVFKFTAATGAMSVSFTFTALQRFNFYWGDLNSDKDVQGISVTQTHTYTTAGTYYIIVAGTPEFMQLFNTTATQIWTNLY